MVYGCIQIYPGGTPVDTSCRFCYNKNIDLFSLAGKGPKKGVYSDSFQVWGCIVGWPTELQSVNRLGRGR
jgi:hypothetical protein